jgi:hypothetical protein
MKWLARRMSVRAYNSCSLVRTHTPSSASNDRSQPTNQPYRIDRRIGSINRVSTSKARTLTSYHLVIAYFKIWVFDRFALCFTSQPKYPIALRVLSFMTRNMSDSTTPPVLPVYFLNGEFCTMMHHPGGARAAVVYYYYRYWRNGSSYYDDIIYDDECSLLVHIYVAANVTRRSAQCISRGFVHRS